MWSRIAEEMEIPWRNVEAMHWQIGEYEIARRAGVNPFYLTNQSTGQSHGRLPTVAELTAGVPAYSSQQQLSYEHNNQVRDHGHDLGLDDN